MSRTRSAALFAVKLAVSVTLLVLVLRMAGSRDVAGRLRDIHGGLALLAIAVQLVAVLALAARWRLLALGLLSPLQAVRYTFIGLFYGSVLPGAISGDVAKGAALAWKDRATRTAVLPASILADRLIGLATLAVFFVIACAVLLWRPPAGSAALVRLGAIGLAVTVPLLVLAPLALTSRGRALADRWIGGRLPPAARHAVGRVLGVADTYRTQPGVRMGVVLLSLVIQTCNVVFYVIVLRALGLAAPLHLVVVLYSVLAVLVLIPISVSGFGVREWFTLAFFPAIGLAADAGVAFSLTTIALTWILAAVGVLWQLADLLPLSSRRRRGPPPTRAATGPSRPS
jgi:glycosyltransferase 2 family protein